MTEFNQAKFESHAKKLVAKYLNYEADEKDMFDEKDVYIVRFNKVEVCAKAMLRSDRDYHYFEVTYFFAEENYILDVYEPTCWDLFHEEEL